MILEALTDLARQERLDVFGLCHTLPEDKLGQGTLVLLGPAEPGFWPHFSNSDEYLDGRPDPMDRWSTRVIGEMARSLNATALFPFGSPARPFITWALRSARAWSSPVHLLVHDTAGLMVSYRGALLVNDILPLEAASQKPCDACPNQPCLSACPAAALTGEAYDLTACHAFLDSAQANFCMSKGCAVRRSCPISQMYSRVDEQSAFHMERFHK